MVRTLNNADFVDVIAIGMSAFYFVFRPFWFGNLEDGPTKCALVTDGLGLDGARVLWRIL